MNQSEVMHVLTARFAEKFKKIAKVKIRDFLDDYKKEEQPTIVVTFLGLEEVKNHHNMHEQIQVKGVDPNGSQVEYLTKPPSMFELSFIVTPYFKTYTDSLKIMGSIVQVIKDDAFLKAEEYDWVGNNNMDIMIEPIQGMGLEKQMQLFNLIRIEYRPSLFYKILVGVNSGMKESFKRVEERKINAHNKNDKN